MEKLSDSLFIIKILSTKGYKCIAYKTKYTITIRYGASSNNLPMNEVGYYYNIILITITHIEQCPTTKTT